MQNPRRLLGAAAPLLIVGLIGFYSLTQRPSFQAIRTVDALQLVGSGMCFGVALVFLIFGLRGRAAE